MNDMFDVHADDYAISPKSDKTILDLCRAGKLDSISFIPNLSYSEEAARALTAVREEIHKPLLVSVHINFVEGHCCADRMLVQNLIDKDGLFTVTWGKLFIWNYIPFLRRKIRTQLKTEIIAQVEKLLAPPYSIISGNSIRFDSHQHTHMIPLVFDALQDAIREKGWGVEFIRNTQDPIGYYLRVPSLYKTYSPINIIKCMILNFYSAVKVRPALRKMGLSVGLMCGVFFSGHMDKGRLSKLLPIFAQKTLKKQNVTEVLFHPCKMEDSEITAEFNKAGINEFHLSENRLIEYEAVASDVLS